MASKAQRGTKRTCQSDSCGARFYDLARTPIVCPMCGSAYVLAVSAGTGQGAEVSRRPVKKPVPVVPQEEPGAEPGPPEGDDALAAVAEEEGTVAEGDETFLEEEEDEGGDVTGIIGDVPEGEEEA